jgi:hypothetical protein
MGAIRLPPPVRFFASIILNDPSILSAVDAELSERVGAIDDRTGFMPFSESDYYCAEMGEGLTRYFVQFQPLLERDTLAELKLKTNAIEASYAVDGRRSVNIDPGYVALEHVILGTTKGYAHRIYLGRGIFADLTLVYKNGTYRSLPWTYPDYGGKELICLLNRWRENYKRSLRCQRA